MKKSVTNVTTSLLDLIPDLKKVSSTNGGEWAGPCPFCKGRNRFRVWPLEGATGIFWCRVCGKHGDGLALVMGLKGLSFPEALKIRGLSSPSFTGHWSRRPNGNERTWIPREAKVPGTLWQERAGIVLEACQRALWGPVGVECRACLTERGLTRLR